MYQSVRLEAPTYGLAPSSDGDNHRTCHLTVHCFLARKCGVPMGIHKLLDCSSGRVMAVLSRNGRKDGGQQ